VQQAAHKPVREIYQKLVRKGGKKVTYPKRPYEEPAKGLGAL